MNEKITSKKVSELWSKCLYNPKKSKNVAYGSYNKNTWPFDADKLLENAREICAMAGTINSFANYDTIMQTETHEQWTEFRIRVDQLMTMVEAVASILPDHPIKTKAK